MLSTELALRQTAVSGVLVWSQWDADRGIALNAYLVSGTPNVLVNPLPLSSHAVQRLREYGDFKIVVTDAHCERAANLFAQELSAEVVAMPRSGSIGRARAIALDGFTTPDQWALYLDQAATLITGHALTGDRPGTLRIAEDESAAGGTAQLCSALRRIRSLEPTNVLVSEGTCIFGGASQALAQLIQSLGAATLNRVNIDELSWIDRVGPGRIRRRQAEIGLLIGAKKLGYQLMEIAPGNIATPMHAHSEEEELYFILEGSGKVRMANGEFPVRKGDFVAFDVGRSGTHQIRNDGDAPLLMLALSNVAPGDCCEYPDSDKLLFARGVMRRLVDGNGGVDLDYWYGETG
jgi:uncharacterized cupin superfamily protein